MAEPESELVIIARRGPTEHVNGAPGTWTVEYRVRTLSGPETYDRIQGYGSHVLEARYSHEQDSEYCTHHDGVWHSWNRAQSGLEAALSCVGDSAYQEAESLHPWHEAVKAEVQARKVRAARIAEIMQETHFPARSDRFGHTDAYPMTDDDVVKEVQRWATEMWEREAKAARIWSKVLRNAADPVKVRYIKERVRKAYDEALPKELAKHHELLAELAQLQKEEGQ